MPWATNFGTGWAGGPGTLTGGFYLVSARASSSRSVVVTASLGIRYASPILTGDGSNPSNWTVTDTETGDTFQVLTTRPGALATQVELILVTALPSPVDTYRVSAPGLIATTGVGISTPSVAYFTACPVATDAPVSQQLVDIRNPATPHSPAGVLIVGSDGDYSTETGDALLRKLLFRRLLTPKGGFRHMPDYGLGLRKGEIYTASDLVKLRSEVERQMRQEPEIADVSARVSLTGSNVLTIALKAKIVATGQQITTGPVPVNNGIGSL